MYRWLLALFISVPALGAYLPDAENVKKGGVSTNLASVAATNFYGAFTGDGSGITGVPGASGGVVKTVTVQNVASTWDVGTGTLGLNTNDAAAGGGGNATGYQQSHIHWSINQANAPSSYSTYTFYPVDNTYVTQNVVVVTNYCNFNTNTFQFFPPTSGLYQLSVFFDNAANLDYKSFSAPKLGTNWYGSFNNTDVVAMEYVMKGGPSQSLVQNHRGSFSMYYPAGETNGIKLWYAQNTDTTYLFYNCRMVLERLGD